MAASMKEKCLSVLDQIENILELKETPNFAAEAAHFRERLEDNEFRISVVGEFSSGKSTFINAILGQDVLQHATTETTATITRIVNTSPNDKRCRTGLVYFRNGKTIPLQDFKSLKEYTTTASQNYQVAEEVVSVDLYLPVLDAKRPIVLIDTPGLNGMADGHRSQTIQLIQRSHACIYLLQRRGLTDSDVQTLKYLCSIQKNFIFVQNFIDELQQSEGESAVAKLHEQERILQEQVFLDTKDVHYSICGVSALLALVSQDNTIEKLYANSTNTLSQTERKELYSRSNFEEFRNILQDTFQDTTLDAIQYGDTAKAMRTWLQRLTEQIGHQGEMAREAYETSSDRKAAEKLDHLKDKVLSDRGRQENLLKNFITSKTDEIRRENAAQLETTLNHVYSSFQTTIYKFQTIDELEHWSENISARIHNDLEKPIDDHFDQYSQELSRLYQIVLQRIQEYSSIQNDDLDLHFDIKKPKFKEEKNFRQETHINKLRQQILSQEADLSSIARDKSGKEQEQRKALSESSSIAELQKREEAFQQQQLRQLGRRPQVQERSEDYIDWEYRGGLGFLDALLGPKEVTRSRVVRDDSMGEEWDRKKAKIQNEHLLQQEQLSRQLNAAQRKEQSLRKQVSESTDMLQRVQEKIHSLEKQLKQEEKLLEEQKRLAQIEYLSMNKKNLSSQIEDYLLKSDTSIFYQIRESMQESLSKETGIMTEQAIAAFHKAIEKKLDWIKSAKENRMPAILKEIEKLEDIQGVLKKLSAELE